MFINKTFVRVRFGTKVKMDNKTPSLTIFGNADPSEWGIHLNKVRLASMARVAIWCEELELQLNDGYQLIDAVDLRCRNVSDLMRDAESALKNAPTTLKKAPSLIHIDSIAAAFKIGRGHFATTAVLSAARPDCTSRICGYVKTNMMACDASAIEGFACGRGHSPEQQHARFVWSVHASFEDRDDSGSCSDSTDGVEESKAGSPRSYPALIDDAFAGFMSPYEYSAQEFALMDDAEKRIVLSMVLPAEVKITFKLASKSSNMRVDYIQGV